MPTEIFNPGTQEIMSRIAVTAWRDGTVLTPANESAYLGALYEKDGTGYYRYGYSGYYAISRLSVVAQSNFQKLLNDLGTVPSVVLIDAALTLTASMSVPANIMLVFQPGAVITLNGNVTLTVLSPVEAGARQLFNCNAAVSCLVLLKGNDIVKVDWFGTGTVVDGSGAQDDTVVIQRAVNCAYQQTLQFTKGKLYRFTNVYLPADIRLEGNGALVKPNYFTSFSGYSLFYLTPNRINPATGLWGGGGGYTGTAGLPLNVNRICICNFSFDAEGSNKGFFGASNGSLSYSTVKYVEVSGNEIRNSSNSNVITISGAANVRANTGFIETCLVQRNTISWSGANQGLISKSDYAVGATSLDIRTIDGGSITERVMIGRFIQIGSTVVPTESTGSYTGTAAVYRITGLTQTGPSEGTLSIASGVYTTANGWVQDGTNLGLKSPIVTNAWLLPITSTRLSVATLFPSFNGAAGATTLTRSSTSALQNAYGRNLYPGLKFSFITGTSGVYTIASVSAVDGSITISPGLATAISAQTIQVDGNLSSSLVLSGDIRNLEVAFNTIVGGSHGIRLNGSSLGRGYFSNALKTYFNFYGNLIEYNAMNIEAQRGATDPFLTDAAFKTLFDAMALSAGQTAINIPNSGNYRVTQKDLNGDGVAENVLTLAATTDPNVTSLNSITAGDIFTFDGVRGSYMITDIPTIWAGTITVSRWDSTSKSLVSGGLMNGVASAQSQGHPLNVRVYSDALGGAGSFRQLRFKDNRLRYPTESYNMSLAAEEFVIENNEFEICERTPCEFGGTLLIFKENNVRSTTFVAGSGLSIPANMSSSSGKGYGNYMSLSVADVRIINNNFDGYQPATGTYSVLSGAFAHTKNTIYPEYELRFLMTGNKIFGTAGTLTITNSTRLITGYTQSFDTVAYEYFEFQDNTVVFSPAALNPMIRCPHGIYTMITGNRFHLSSTGGSGRHLFLDLPNPEIFGTGPFNVVVDENQYFNQTVPLKVAYNNNDLIMANIRFGDYSYVNSISRNFGTAIPTGGTYLKGSIMFNSNYDGALSTVIYWVCTATGTPGTWVGVTP